MGYIQRFGLVMFIIGIAGLIVSSLSASLNTIDGSFIITMIGALLFVLSERKG